MIDIRRRNDERTLAPLSANKISEHKPRLGLPETTRFRKRDHHPFALSLRRGHENSCELGLPLEQSFARC
jgi:hypothetical protein